MIVSIERVGSSLLIPFIRLASKGLDCPSLYQMIFGGGEPPIDAHVKFRGLPSVAVVSDGEIFGLEG